MKRRSFIARSVAALGALAGLGAAKAAVAVRGTNTVTTIPDVFKPAAIQYFRPNPNTMGMWNGMEGASLDSLIEAGWFAAPAARLEDCTLGRGAYVVSVDRERRLVKFGVEDQ